MKEVAKQSAKSVNSLTKQRNYNEVIEYFDAHWSVAQDTTLERMKSLNEALGSPASKVNTILVAGVNGKSLTSYFISRLFKEEGIKVGSFFAPHILTYNERFSLNLETIANKTFTEIANDIINTAEQRNLKCNTFELLSAMALVYFEQNKVDVAVLEVHHGGKFNPLAICNPKILAITRVTPENTKIDDSKIPAIAEDILQLAKSHTHVVSSDQSKATLQLLEDLSASHGFNWAMPIRKLVDLESYSQLHGRCAALAERVALLFAENFLAPQTTLVSGSLLIKPVGQRGRPTLQAKKERDINPVKTLEQFWKETSNEMPGRFQLLDKEKPSILLDTACNMDALENVLLGIRLLHYQRPLKGLSLIMAAAQDTLYNEEFLKALRYFFKKTSGQIFICPIIDPVAGVRENNSWDAEHVANDIKAMKIKAKACKNFEEAFELAKKSVDERNGLVVITGSHSIVNSYWMHKGIKKF